MPIPKKATNPLVKEKVIVKLIKRSGNWLEQIDKNHDGANLWSEAKITFTGVPYDIGQGRYIDPLTPEEKAWFESKDSGLGLEVNEMSVLKKENFWINFTVSLTRNGLTINKGDVMGYLKWKYLLCLPQVAPSWEERFNSASYKFALVGENQVFLERAKKSDLNKAALRFFGKIDHSVTKMGAFLTMYQARHNIRGKTLPDNASREFLVSELDQLIEQNISGFLEVVDDPDYVTREFIYGSLKGGHIVKKGKAQYSIMGDEEKFSFNELIEYFKSPESNAIHAKITKQLQEVS